MPAARPDALLRRVLLLDAVSCVGMGAALVAAPALLETWLGLSPVLTRGAGLALFPFAALLVWTARRPTVPRGVAWGLVAGNVLWAVDSFALPATPWLAGATALGVAFVVAQGAVVAAFAALEAVGLRRAAA
ncbi:hypothetical protein [Roseisolibacter sp. H3M3-2]|uniref:hypothetical protein n=1 Tax=Roseisolibacter sp. H3M3-2 TaxID=3031323 RepID=UPI0023DAF26E|nr:hypothetical protein [Roseisolibacter sp. H3M3-2]MDF1505619.1 hypothetical protein [Roseisolibacter sp. H3M3-2]